MMTYMDYLKTEKFPLFWCAGCGNGTVLGAIARALKNYNLKKQNSSSNRYRLLG